MSETFWTTTEDYMKRGWNDIEPKLLTAALSGSLGVEVVSVLQSYHVPITPTFAQWIPLGIAIAAGYIQKSKGKSVTKTVHLDPNTTMEKTVTGPIRVVREPEPEPIPFPSSAQPAAPAKSWIADAVARQTGPEPALVLPQYTGPTSIITPDDQATQVFR